MNQLGSMVQLPLGGKSAFFGHTVGVTHLPANMLRLVESGSQLVCYTCQNVPTSAWIVLRSLLAQSCSRKSPSGTALLYQLPVGSKK